MDDIFWRKWQKTPSGPKKDRMLDKLVRDNLPLVHKLVSRHLQRTSVHIDTDDAMQAGAIGLLRAIRGHNPDRGTKFSTYATHWIRHEVQTCLLHQTQLYRPKGTGMPYKEHRAAEAIEAITGRDANAEELGVSETQLEKWRSIVFHFIPIDESRERICDDGSTMAHRNSAKLQDPKPIADALMDQAQINRRLAKCLKVLSDFEHRVLIDEERCGMTRAKFEAVQTFAIEKVRQAFLDVD